MTNKKIDFNLVPENIKNIIQRANPQNPHVNDTERMMAISQLETIIALIEKSLEIFNTPKK